MSWPWPLAASRSQAASTSARRGAAVEVDAGREVGEVGVAVEQVDPGVAEGGIAGHQHEPGPVGAVLDAEVREVALPRGTY